MEGSMDVDYGKQMGKALQAVCEMHSDCTRLIQDLDKELSDCQSLLGNTVALEIPYALSRRAYLAEVLARLYVRKQNENQVLGINLCFYDRNGSKFEEPIFIAANTRYQLGIPDDKFKRGGTLGKHF
jgi:hypothetical protein